MLKLYKNDLNYLNNMFFRVTLQITIILIFSINLNRFHLETELFSDDSFLGNVVFIILKKLYKGYKLPLFCISVYLSFDLPIRFNPCGGPQTSKAF